MQAHGHSETEITAGAEAAEGGARDVDAEGRVVFPDPHNRGGAVFYSCWEGVFRGEAVVDTDHVVTQRVSSEALPIEKPPRGSR